MTSLRECIDEKCKECCYDPFVAGTWREQVAVNCTPSCKLFKVRPVPRDCRKDGAIDSAAIAALALKLERIDQARVDR